MVAGKIANLLHGGPIRQLAERTPSAAAAAVMLNVGTRTVERAREVLDR